MLEEIGRPDEASSFLNDAIAKKRKIMGFGHREYRVKDPRATILQAFAEELFLEFGKDEMYEVAKALEEEAITAEDLHAMNEEPPENIGNGK